MHIQQWFGCDYVCRPVELENAVLACESWPQDVAPYLVVLSDTRCGPPLAVLPVTDNSGAKLRSNFTVCLHKAFIHGYDNVAQFVEWVEVNRILGADRFLVYNFTGNPVLLPYIEHYVRTGVVEFHQWPVHDFEDRIPGYMGQVALINDCIFRSMYDTRYLLLVDVDEFVVPQTHSSWPKLLTAAVTPCATEPDTLVQNTFFLRQHPADGSYTRNQTLVKLKLDTLSLMHRVNFTFPCSIRTKLIVQPKLVTLAAVHYAVDLVNGREPSSCCMPQSLVRLHHYRKWHKSVNHSWHDEFFNAIPYHPYFENVVEDRRMDAFSARISGEVANVYNEVNQTILSK